MNTLTRYLAVAILLAPTAPALAADILVPDNTVIPVTLDKALSSATNKVGDTFMAHHEGINGGGFPEHTKFAGRVESVTKASGKTAGQIAITFVSARFPNGASLPIRGKLTSLDEKSVSTDPETGRLVGTVAARKADLRLIAYGAGGGLLLGELTGKNKTLLTVLGAAAGYAYSQKQAKPAIGKDVRVPAGTKFGVLLTEDVTIPDTDSTTPTGSSATDPTGPGWEVTFNELKPVMKGNDLMVPLRSVMNSIDMPFDYDSTTRQISVTNYEKLSRNTLGSRVVETNGVETWMGTPSRIIKGAMYVPASFIELVTGRSAYWNQKSGVLRIE